MVVKAVGIKKDFIRKSKDTNLFCALKKCDITIKGGEFICVYGRSGSGKSTLVSILSGILKPSEGQVLYDGEDIHIKGDKALSEFIMNNIGYIPQGKSAIASLNVLDNILLKYTLCGGVTDEVKTAAISLMEKLDIANIAEAMPEELSGGELRRMAIARALIMSPQVIFADEPTGDLDDENTAKVFDTLKELAADGAAVMMISHENEAKDYADVLYRMDGGELIWER